MSDSVTFNPYEAPQQAFHQPGLAPDTEFLFSSECVLCGDTVKLPAVCISTGHTEDLVQQSAELTWVPRWLDVLRILFTVFCLMTVGGLAQRFSPLLVVGSAVTVVVVLLIVSHRLTHRLRATWYVDRKIHDDEVRRHRFWKLVTVSCAAVTVACIVAGLFLRAPYLFSVVPLSFPLAIIANSRTARKNKPVFAGRHEGLNILTGLSATFLANVQEIVERQ